MYISDRISKEYENWKNGDLIFIEAPTGSGKTTFVLEHLLPYFHEKGKRILYLVNRKILKKQLKKELKKNMLANRI